MRKIPFVTQNNIVDDYINGMKYAEIMKKYKVNRWNIQNTLSKMGVKTNRIKSSPRLAGGDKKKSVRIERNIPSIPETEYKLRGIEHNFILEDDLDIMERMDNDLANEEGQYLEIDVDENDEIRYKKNE